MPAGHPRPPPPPQLSSARRQSGPLLPEPVFVNLLKSLRNRLPADGPVRQPNLLYWLGKAEKNFQKIMLRVKKSVIFCVFQQGAELLLKAKEENFFYLLSFRDVTGTS
jgi:hypothetical protein